LNILEKYPNIRFHENEYGGVAELFHSDRQTDVRTERLTWRK